MATKYNYHIPVVAILKRHQNSSPHIAYYVHEFCFQHYEATVTKQLVHAGIKD